VWKLYSLQEAVASQEIQKSPANRLIEVNALVSSVHHNGEGFSEEQQTVTFAALLHVCTVEIGEAQFRSVLAVARTLRAHLSIVVVGTAALPPVGAHMESVSAPWMEERRKQQAGIENKVSQLEKRLREGGVPHEVQNAYTEVFTIDNEIGYLARLSDIVLIGPDLLSNQEMLGAILDGSWFHAEVPVLLDPGASLKLEKPVVMIAWSDTAESASAVRASIPFLNLAKSVHVVLVDQDGDPNDPAPKLMAYLFRHGIADISIDVLASDGRTVSETLEGHAKSINADLVVMGAYGHTRLRERLFGGVTRSTVKRPGRPIFMAR